MKFGLITPWKNAWVPLVQNEVRDRGWDFFVAPSSALMAEFSPDVVLHGWFQGAPVERARNVYCLRRFELYGACPDVPLERVDEVVCCNTAIAGVVEGLFAHMTDDPPNVSVIYNAVDRDLFKDVPRKPDAQRQIGMVGFIVPKKGHQMALQILAGLPEGYELNLAGEIQDSALWDYLGLVAKRLRVRVVHHGHLSRDELAGWWSMMGICLSCSFSEGNPNAVIEGMATGAVPVIHNWPGAETQFPERWRFDTVEQAVQQIRDVEINGEAGRAAAAHVEQHFSSDNIRALVDLAANGARTMTQRATA